MTWARRAAPVEESGHFAEAHSAARARWTMENSKAARTVASHATDARDCTHLLAMLGLDVVQAKRDRET
jgi:hypothetical protein